MVDVNPFYGILYNPEKVGRIEEVVTPPYDVITPEAQEAYYRRHEYNVIRLDLGKTYPDDGPTHNRYSRAAAYFQEWRKNKILIRDGSPSFYRYEITYALSPHGTPSGQLDLKTHAKTLRGFFGAVKLEPYSTGRILPHEDTFPKVKEDRLNLLRACRANFSPILTLYADPEDRVQKLLEQGSAAHPPRIDLTHEGQTRHRLWEVDDPDIIREIQQRLSGKILLIADGHHRYETALAFQKEYPKADQMLMLLVNMRDPGLSLLPYHRVLHGLAQDRVEDLVKNLSRYFQITDLPDLTTLQKRMEESGKKQPTLGAYDRHRGFLLLRIKPEGVQKATAGSRRGKDTIPLDVDIFDQLVLDELLGLKGGATDRDAHVIYIKDAEEGVEKVRQGQVQMAFFLNPVSIQTVQNLAQQGIKMPHKSTYFYPKPLSGLVINALPNDAD